MTTTTKSFAVADYGSFKDSLRAPVHRWFTYPAGFSYRFVEVHLRQFDIGLEDTVLDPFAGTGTTSLSAKSQGINSIGIEAHPYVHKVAETKLRLNLDTDALRDILDDIIFRASSSGKTLLNEYPDLVYKCFEEESLAKLDALRAIIQEIEQLEYNAFFQLALAATLRKTTTAGAGWPYIAPSKHARRKAPREPLAAFEDTSMTMILDMLDFQAQNIPISHHEIICDDAKNLTEYLSPNQISLIVTSPPYLNNYDYADRTRLETYFLGHYSSWGEITKNVRSRLMVSATTQISLSEMSYLTELSGIQNTSSSAYSYLLPRIETLNELRDKKKGRKTYDILVAGYFEDMLVILRQCFSTLTTGGAMVVVIGDSAPYGVHVETEEVLAMLAMDIGFSSYDVEVIRQRGEKWAGNTQRHRVALKESILTLYK